MQAVSFPIVSPPKVLRKTKLDNIAIVPASLLQVKGTYQPLANTLPKGSILLIATHSPRQKRILASVTVFLRQHGRRVITLPIERLRISTSPGRKHPGEALRLAL